MHILFFRLDVVVSLCSLFYMVSLHWKRVLLPSCKDLCLNWH